MTIAELFVNIGVKGEGSTKKALEGTQKGLGDIASAGLAAKAAIVAAIYGLEQLMSHSAQAGTALTNLNAVTGISTQVIQQWEYAGQQAGDTFDGVASSIRSVWTKMQEIHGGGGPSAAFGTIAQYLPGGIDENRAFKDTIYMMGKLQEFSQLKTLPKAFKSQWLSAFVGEGTQAAMARNAFNQNNFDKAPKYSEKEIKNLDKINASWKNIGTQIEMAIGHLTSKHGMQFVTEISKITDAVFKLVDVLTQLSEFLGVFEGIATLFNSVNSVVGSGVKSAQDLTKGKFKDSAKDFGSFLGHAVKSTAMLNPGNMLAMKAYEHFVPHVKTPDKGHTVNAPQTVNIIGQKNPAEIGKEVSKQHQKHLIRTASGIPKQVL